MIVIDPIDRIALMEKLGIGKECTVCEQNSDPYCKWKPDVVDVCEAICTAPTIEPQRTGRWIPVTNGRGGHECDQCHEYAPSWATGEEHLTNYCPNCGADMRTPVDIAKDIVHKIIDNTAWSDTVDTAKMHKVVDDKYAEIRGDANVDANT